MYSVFYIAFPIIAKIRILYTYEKDFTQYRKSNTDRKRKGTETQGRGEIFYSIPGVFAAWRPCVENILCDFC